MGNRPLGGRLRSVMRFAPPERLSGSLPFSSVWRKRQVGVNSSEKAPSLMRTYNPFPFLILIHHFVIL